MSADTRGLPDLMRQVQTDARMLGIGVTILAEHIATLATALQSRRFHGGTRPSRRGVHAIDTEAPAGGRPTLRLVAQDGRLVG